MSQESRARVEDSRSPERGDNILLGTIHSLTVIPIATQDPPTPEEIERRRAIYEASMALRAKMKPLRMPIEELFREENEGTGL